MKTRRSKTACAGTLLTLEEEGFQTDPVIDGHVDGDGTVTLDVLEHCKQWKRVAPRAFEGGEHLGMMHDEAFLGHAALLVTSCWSEHVRV